jgi:hypothetical protein
MTESINFAMLVLRFGESCFSSTVALVVGPVSFVCLEENSPFLVSISFSSHGIAAVLLQGLQSDRSMFQEKDMVFLIAA